MCSGASGRESESITFSPSGSFSISLSQVQDLCTHILCCVQLQLAIAILVLHVLMHICMCLYVQIYFLERRICSSYSSRPIVDLPAKTQLSHYPRRGKKKRKKVDSIHSRNTALLLLRDFFLLLLVYCMVAQSERLFLPSFVLNLVNTRKALSLIHI